MVKCTECKYHLDSPIDYVIDGLTGEKLVEWGHYCPIHEQLYTEPPRECMDYTPYTGEGE